MVFFSLPVVLSSALMLPNIMHEIKETGIKPRNTMQMLPRWVQVIKKKIANIYYNTIKLSYAHFQI